MKNFSSVLLNIPQFHQLSHRNRFQISNNNNSQQIDISNVPSLSKFLENENISNRSTIISDPDQIPYIRNIEKEKKILDLTNNNQYFIQTYGCQMNVSDTEIIQGILDKAGYKEADDINNSNVVFLNTCAIRENAENKIWKRLEELRANKQKGISQQITGVLGCMAERLKENLIEQNKVVDLVVGPDAYRDIPRILESLTLTDQKQKTQRNSINVQLSMDQTYADITPLRTDKSQKVAYLSIMRGCNNMCSFCIVPFTRGRERNRPMSSIIDQVQQIRDQGYSEIMLLGQNVNSYHDSNEQTVDSQHENAEGFQELYRLRNGSGARFANLLEQIAIQAPEVRIRFTSPHPQDFPDPVLDAINAFPNIAQNVHLPAQSGNSNVLERMRRYYTRESYIKLVDHIQSQIPGVTLSSDFIVGFCGETQEEFNDTLTLMDYVQYEHAYMFAYSMREKTHAHRQMIDDVDPIVQNRRLQQLVARFNKNQQITTQTEVGNYHLVLVEGQTQYEGQLKGRTDTNRRAIFETTKCRSQMIINEDVLKNEDPLNKSECELEDIKAGDFILCKVDNVSKQSLFCTPIAQSSIKQFAVLAQNKPFFQI